MQQFINLNYDLLISQEKQEMLFFGFTLKKKKRKNVTGI